MLGMVVTPPLWHLNLDLDFIQFFEQDLSCSQRGKAGLVRVVLSTPGRRVPPDLGIVLRFLIYLKSTGRFLIFLRRKKTHLSHFCFLYLPLVSVDNRIKWELPSGNLQETEFSFVGIALWMGL